MKKFAVIDIGSNSVRLMLMADGKVLYKMLNTTRLGEGLAFSSQLKPEAITRTANAVCAFYQQALAEQAEGVVAFATAAVRSAENGYAFVQEVHNLCGLTVEIVSGEEEATLGIIGALGVKDGGLIDVGGASTELVVQEKGSLVYKKSIDVGIVRLHDACGRDAEALQALTMERVKQFLDAPKLKEVYAIGGTATTLAALSRGLEKYDSAMVTGTEITKGQMQALAQELLRMPVEEIAKMPCVSKGREDVLAGGALWFATLMQTLGIEKITISDRDNLEGYALKKGLLC